MPTLKISKRAFADIRRLYNFLQPKNKDAAQRAVDTITEHLYRLEQSPYLGASYYDDGSRRLVIPFGQSSYIALYEIKENIDQIHVLRVMNSRENISPFDLHN